MRALCSLHLRCARVWLVLFGVVAVMCSGCGRGDSGLVSASGTVSYRGEPVVGAHVAFRGDGAATPAVGTTDSSGHFTLTTGKLSGATVGEHVVTVIKFADTGETSPVDVSMEDAGREGQIAESQHELPQKYAAAANSDLRHTVSEDGQNNFDIVLTD